MVFNLFIILYLWVRKHRYLIETFCLLCSSLLFLLHGLLVFDTISIFDELVIESVLNKPIKHTSSNNEISLGYFVSKTTSSHQFDNHWLRCLNPICFKLLIPDTIEKHLAVLFSVSSPLSLYCLEISFIWIYIIPNFPVESWVKFGESKFSLSSTLVSHCFNLCQLFSKDISLIS